MTYGLRLIFSAYGDVRLSRGGTQLSPDEREMSLNVTLPRALFRTPTLRATIQVGADNSADTVKLNLDAAGDALRKALGCDVVLELKGSDDERA